MKTYIKDYGWLVILLLIIVIILFRVTAAIDEYKCELKSDVAAVVITLRNEETSLATILKKISDPSAETVDRITTAFNMKTNNPNRAKKIAYNACMGIE